MAEHKNIVARWREAKASFRQELTRLGDGLGKIRADIRTECGQDVSRVEWECGGTLYNLGDCGGPYALVYVRGQSGAISLASPVSSHWSVSLRSLESVVAYLATVTVADVRVMAEKAMAT